ncbi:MAG TPA: hypothetical protein VH044_16085, partial [Polyangiaceae bacterium]|nr:hypothetical protein [Polyangiaceae bacterium]
TIAEVRRTGRGRLAAPRDAVLVSAAAGLLFALFGDPVVSGRSFYAWGQHYAVTQAERGHLDVDPWINWTSLVQHDFGQVDTISGALRANPAAFARNVLHNAGELPSQLADTITPLGFLPQTPCMIVYTLLLVAGAIGVVGRWRRGGPTARPLKIVAVVWFCVGINALPGALIIQPRHHYLLLFSALSVALAAAGLADGLRVLLARGPERWRARMATWDHAPSTRAVAATAAMLFVLMPNRAYGACLQTAIGLVRKPRPDPHETARTAAALHALGIARKVVVLEQGYSYVFYSGLAFDRVREWTKDRPFGTWLHDNDISVVVLSEAIFRNGAFASDPEFIDFAYDPASFGFRPLPVLGTPNTFAIRDDIETTGAPR